VSFGTRRNKDLGYESERDVSADVKSEQIEQFDALHTTLQTVPPLHEVPNHR
jgi:hypothetical protein